jgi:hypothetical protein
MTDGPPRVYGPLTLDASSDAAVPVDQRHRRVLESSSRAAVAGKRGRCCNKDRTREPPKRRGHESWEKVSLVYECHVRMASWERDAAAEPERIATRLLDASLCGSASARSANDSLLCSRRSISAGVR